MLVRPSLLLLAVSLILTGGARARADQVPAFGGADDGFDQAFSGYAGPGNGGTMGWVLDVGPRDLRVTSLGVFDGSGLGNSHPVAIWDGAGQLVASVTIASGTGSLQFEGYRYEPNGLVTLEAGASYTLGAFYPANSNDAISFFNNAEFSPHLTFGASRQSSLTTGASLTVPLQEAQLDDGIFGPNFRYEAFDIGGNVSGLTGQGLTLQLDGADSLAVSGSGPFRYALLPDGNRYVVSVGSQPSGQTCAVTGGAVDLDGADETGVQVTCGSGLPDGGPADVPTPVDGGLADLPVGDASGPDGSAADLAVAADTSTGRDDVPPRDSGTGGLDQPIPVADGFVLDLGGTGSSGGGCSVAVVEARGGLAGADSGLLIGTLLAALGLLLARGRRRV